MSVTKDEATTFVQTLVDIADSVLNQNHTSLAEYTKVANISSRAFVERSIAGEEVTANILSAVHQLYTAWIIMAMQMSTRISKYETVRDMMQTVASEALLSQQKPFESVFVAMENFGAPATMASGRGPTNVGSGQRSTRDEMTQPLPAGKMVTIGFDDDHGNHVADVDLLITIRPFIVETEVAEQLMTLVNVPSLKQRYLQWSAGEINFLSDLVFHSDTMKKRREALKKDDTGVLNEIIEAQNKGARRTGYSVMFGKNMKNLANTVYVLDKTTFDRACSDSGVDFNNKAQRQKFFLTSFAMMVIVVDPMYSTVTMYINGLDSSGTYPYRLFEKKGMSNGSADMMNQFVQAMSRGSMPRF